jgi:hypothetical protein
MPHGRSHHDREHHLGTGRSHSTPDRADEETQVFAAGRKRWAPREGVFGAHPDRRVPTRETAETSRDRAMEPVGAGAEVAPTAQAMVDQAKRHAAEGSLERIASRTPGKAGAARTPGKAGAKRTPRRTGNA